MSTAVVALQDRLQSASNDFQKIQTDMASAVEARQKLEAQQSENELVKKEFSTLTERNEVYKLVGPVLVKQDQAEAKTTVDKRLEFIASDMCVSWLPSDESSLTVHAPSSRVRPPNSKRIEGQIKDLEEKADKKKLELVEIQTALQQQLKAPAPPAAVAA
ncbi:hypothetical protein DAEQUDRAFT_766325 [Daedalea quercina L-15889]|uniref:Prefoldin n=1 Tax=Daedalea quercina L-15889 TaxID=1314783 RepID=A0A165PQS4_9APHY|nr:hypothetical protein DAEQUDRAFT_766325 [Daedalea quercina L-15889]